MAFGKSSFGGRSASKGYSGGSTHSGGFTNSRTGAYVSSARAH